MRPPLVSGRSRRIAPLVVMLCALALRVVYVPFHLAQDAHLGVGADLVVHETEQEHQHHHQAEQLADHDHGRDHIPHPFLDHASDLILSRGAAKAVPLEFAVLPAKVGQTLLPLREIDRCETPAARERQLAPRTAVRPRGPPCAI